MLVGYQNFVVTNQAYFRMGIAYERSYAYYNRIMERIEATAGYQPGDPFALIGEYGLSETPDLLGSYSMDGDRFTDLSGVAKETGLLTSGVRYNFMKTYIGAEHLRLNDHNTGDLGLSKRKLAHILYLSFVKHVCFIWKSLFDAGFCTYLPRRVCPCSVRVLRRFFRQVMNRTTRKVTSAAAAVDPSEMPSSQNAWLWGFTALAASNS